MLSGKLFPTWIIKLLEDSIKHVVLVFSLLLFLNVGCEKQDTSGKNLSVEPDVEFLDISGHPIKKIRNYIFLNPGRLVRIRYTWQTQDWSPLNFDLTASVHLCDLEGNTFWQDDHQPATSSWQSNQVYSYERYTLLPEKPPKTDGNLLVGLYNPSGQKKYLLPGRTGYRRKITICRLYFYPWQKIKWGYGWEKLSYDISTEQNRRWMSQEAGIKVLNSGSPVFLTLNGHTRIDCFSSLPSLILKTAGETLATFELDKPEFTFTTLLQPESLGTQEWIDMYLQTSDIFVPSKCGESHDDRRLGAQMELPEISNIRFVSGFYPMEWSGWNSWRWMKREGIIELIKPKELSILYLSVGGVSGKISGYPTIELLINDELLDRYILSNDTTKKIYPITRKQIKSDKTFFLKIRSDQILLPDNRHNKDQRELGVMLKEISLLDKHTDISIQRE